MCLAIVKPRGVQIKKEYLANGYDGNPHGCGFAYQLSGNIHVQRGFKSFDAFYEAYREYQRHMMLIHFRWATHGNKGVSNMHPFLINAGQFAVIHNGCLSIKVRDDKSDTRIFCEDVLQPLFRRVRFNDKALRYLVEGNIGAGNKIAVLRYDGKHVIFNEKVGHWHKGAWYSNHGYKTVRYSNIVSTGTVKSSVEKMWSQLGYKSHVDSQVKGKTIYQSVITEPDMDELNEELASTYGTAIEELHLDKEGNIIEKAGSLFPDYEGRAHEQAE